MATNYQMDPVIRRIDKAERKAALAEGFVIDVAREGAWFQPSVFAERWYYRVAKPRDDEGWTKITIEREVNVAEKNWTLPIEISLTLRFGGHSEADARRLVDALREADNPDRGMAIVVGKWIKAFIERERIDNERFVEQFRSRSSALKAYIIAQAKTISLDVTRAVVGARGAGPGRDDVLEIRIPNLYVVLSDYTPEVRLSLDVDLGLAGGSALAYLPSGHQEEVEREIRREIRDLFRTRINLQRWQFELQSSVKSQIAAALCDIAARVGRDVVRLIIGGDAPIEGVDRTLEIEIEDEPFSQLDYPDPVQVNAELRLDLTDLGTLVTSGVPPRHVEAWARDTLREVVSHHLLGEPYVTLFSNFQRKNDETEDAFQAAANATGYRLTRLSLQTNLDFAVLQRGFECRIENAPFPLALRECQVNLDIETRVRITDQGVLEALFKKNTGITQTVSERIRETVAAELRQVRPEEFYLRFYGDGSSPETSVASRLEAAIQNACAPFKPDEPLVVNFALRADELMKVYQDLVQTPIALPRLTEPNTQIAVDVHASVTQIYDAHWLRFQELRPTPERVAEMVEAHVQSFINEVVTLNLQSFLNASTPAVQEQAQNWVNKHLGRNLGVGVTIVHWLRHDPAIIGRLRNWEQEVADLNESLRQISGQLRAAYVSDGPVDELKARQAMVKQALDELHRERGGGFVLTPADPNFRLTGTTAQALLSAPVSDAKGGTKS